MLEQKIISLDATTMNTYQSCALKYKYQFIDNLRPNLKASALEEGDLMHKMLEVFYSLKFGLSKFDSGIWPEILESGLTLGEILDTETIIEFCQKVGLFLATKMNAEPKDLEEVIYQFKAYMDFYKHDPWRALAVEEVGSKVLFENENHKIIWNCKTDLVAEKGSIIAPWDHKTGKRRSTPSSLSNQFIGTCFVLGMNNILINKIGFQKTLKESERFQRFLLTISNARIEEWRTNTIAWALRFAKEQHFPPNLTSCDKYSGCLFEEVCTADPNNRDYVIDKDFSTGKVWDVAKILEVGEKSE